MRGSTTSPCLRLKSRDWKDQPLAHLDPDHADRSCAIAMANVTEEDVMRLAKWQPKSGTKGDVPFVVSRVILQDFTGVPLLVDLAAMRDAVAAKGSMPRSIEPQVPVDLVVDHSVQVDRAGTIRCLSVQSRNRIRAQSESAMSF